MRPQKNCKNTGKPNETHPKYLFKHKSKLSKSRRSKSKDSLFISSLKKFQPKLEIIHEIPLAYEFSNDEVLKRELI